MAEIAQARIGADIARLWLLDDAGETLELRAQTGFIRGTAGLKQRLSPHDSVAGWIIAHKESVCIADVPADTRLVNRTWFAVEGVVSLLAVPIMLDDRPIGILACLSRTRREFTPGDVALARALTAPAVVAVRNAALYADAVARLQEIEAFQRVASEWRSPCSSRTTARSAVSSSGEDKVSDARRWNASISWSRATASA